MRDLGTEIVTRQVREREIAAELAARYQAGYAAGRADAAREISEALEVMRCNYPESVFPSDSTVPDGIAGTAMRHAYGYAARIARQHGEER